MEKDQELYEQARLLITRLERISVDSIWARRSSGHRGALLKWLEQADPPIRSLSEDERVKLEALIQAGFKFLEKAARERFP